VQIGHVPAKLNGTSRSGAAVASHNAVMWQQNSYICIPACQFDTAACQCEI
jgi:hypothetical protein